MEYITNCTLSVNGQEITDFKKVTEKEKTYYKQVNLMNKTGHAPLVARYGVTVDYVVPDGDEFVWRNVKNGTLSFTKGSGKKVTFSGVYILKEGDESVDGENETVKTIELGAENRIEE